MADAATGEQINVGFGANIAGLTAGLGQAVASVRQATGAMSESLNAVTKAGSVLTNAFGTITAVLAGGKLFKDAIKQTMDFAGEVRGLSKQMGISAEEASTLAVALGAAFIDVDTYRNAVTMLTRQMRTNEEGVRAMGVATRDANGHYLAATELMRSARTALLNYKEGTDRNLAAQVMFGRGAGDAAKILRLTDEAMAHAAETSARLGLQMSGADLAAVTDYKKANNELGEVVEASALSVGKAFIPVLTQLTHWVTEAGTAALPVLTLAFRMLATVVAALGAMLYGFWMTIKGIIETIITGVIGIFSAISSLLSGGGIQGAKDEFHNMAVGIEDIWDNTNKKLQAQGKETAGVMDKIWGNVKPETPEVDPKGGHAEFVDPQAAAKQLQLWKQQLAAMQAATGDYNTLSKQAEVDFWADKLDKVKKGSKEWVEVYTAYVAARRDVAKEGVEREKLAMTESKTLAAANKTELVSIAEKWAERMKALYGADSKEYAEALRAKREATRAYDREVLEIDATWATSRASARVADIDFLKEQLDLQKQLGLITNEQLLAQERVLSEAKYRIQLDALEAKKILYAGDALELAKIEAEKAALTHQYQTEGRRAAMSAQAEDAKKMMALWEDLGTRMSGLWDKGMQALMNGTLTWRNAFKAVGAELTSWFANAVVGQLVKDWLAGQVKRIAASMLGISMEKTAQAAGSTAVMGIKTAETTVVAGENAVQAGTGAAAAMAPIPIIGPALALAAMAAIFAAVSSLHSAAGGFDIPAGLNPLTQLHEKEMVLPAHIAEPLRETLTGGGGRGATPIINIHGADARGYLMVHKNELARALKSAHRGFAL
jgi:hypothetical protein